VGVQVRFVQQGLQVAFAELDTALSQVMPLIENEIELKG